MRLYIILLFLFCACLPAAQAQQVMQGIVTDMADKKPMSNVNIEDIYTHLGTVTDSSGHFSLTVAKGELVEFRKIGYKIARVRISQGSLPPFFRIIMEKGAVELPEFEVKDRHRDYTSDSVRYHELYKEELDFPTLSGLAVIEHPFSALSKRNREIWAFQKEYAYWEKQKYVDYKFNDKLITGITGLQGDSLLQYKRIYRPSPEMLRSMSEYDFLIYIRRTVEWYRQQARRYRGMSSGRP